MAWLVVLKVGFLKLLSAALSARPVPATVKVCCGDVLDYTSQKLRLNAGAARLSQISGSSGHAQHWNWKEWFPRLILSTLHLKALPSSIVPGQGALGSNVDWKSDQGNPYLRVFHPLHPRPVRWSVLLPSIHATMEEALKENIEIVSLSKWVAHLQETNKALTENDARLVVQSNPGIKLLEFYQKRVSEHLIFDNAQAMESSTTTLRNLESMKLEWVVKWVTEWVG
ncbi:hypothetical protein AJ79_10102 [Helicocarpus griseus UAMH5409]|uniref:Uncharacterized protein n=1 Tax=Helicocarpus griseus UAMH5409 TaxID=1447875 RepID=A0A2B7WFI9_9EURO|nr:hypothetical protein AJ79_10102 [Helicocarpus griseus UAMH5409]